MGCMVLVIGVQYDQEIEEESYHENNPIKCKSKKNWNTARLLKAAAEGAAEAGAEVTYVDLYDLNFTGCRSCLLCKRKGVERCRCYWKDDLSPILEKVFAANTLLIGTSIYLGRPTSQFFAFLERLHFSALSYDDYSNYFTGSVKVGMFVTMNATKPFYEQLYKEKFAEIANEFSMLNGEVERYPCYNTLQVNDYTKYNMAGFDEEKKTLAHKENFPKDLERAFEIGKKLSQ